MNKSALRNFATNARRELLERVELQARKIGITKDKIEEASLESSDSIFINGRQLTDVERKQRNKLIVRIEEIGFDRVMEEAAYTWFNRFVALRFMEVNDYLPTRVRVLSSEKEDSTEPDMIREALSLDLEIDKEYVYNLKMKNNTDELFKYLIKLHCNDLNRYMPFMFETIEDYMAILFPEGLLGADSFVREMTNTEAIPEENWEKVEIIGWLYQYYIAEEKDQVFANLKKNIKITKDTLPAATQLFTPNWIVRYMVENSLGRIWMESYPNSSLKNKWKYYLDEAEQSEEVIKQLEDIRYKDVNPEEITFLDPCCGSGHILVYAFDVFYEMYLEKGYMESEIPRLILEKNLFGLDVDDRAAQLASFSVMMRARAKSRRLFQQEPKLNIISIQESNWLTEEMIVKIAKNELQSREALHVIKKTFLDAKEYGSILKMEDTFYKELEMCLKEFKSQEFDLIELIDKQIVEQKFPQLIAQAKILNNLYDVVCTNPPYMGSKGMNLKLREFTKQEYPSVNRDLSTVFMDVASILTKEQGYFAMINIPTWMYLSSYEEYRQNLLQKNTIINLLHLGRGVFGSDFGTTSFVIKNLTIPNYVSKYKKLFEQKGNVESNEVKKRKYFEANEYLNVQENFKVIEGSPIAYNMSKAMVESFKNGIKVNEISAPRQGLATGNNNYYLRNWYEVERTKVFFHASSSEEFFQTGKKYAPYNKGGSYRKWYGNCEYLIKFNHRHYEKLAKVGNKLPSRQYYFQNSLTWSKVTIGGFSIRYLPNGFVFDVSGCSLFMKDDEDILVPLLGFLNSKVASLMLSFLSPTVNYEVGHVGNTVILPSDNQDIIDKTVKQCVELSKTDWDSFETSWDFEKHPILKFPSNKIESSFKNWENLAKKQFNQLKKNEEELNRIFIETYGLQDELTPEVEDKDVTVRKAELERDIKSFISYAVGCTFGRYSIDEDGLIYAGGEFDPSRYKSFSADEDNILPILPGAYFEDDIVNRFIKFVEVTYGTETLEENLQYVADAIGRRKNETARESIRRYFLNNFYKDHLQTYKKHPIYWLFTSGKEKAFNCLIYMHRYDKTTLSRIRTDYLHEVQTRYESIKQDLQSVIEGNGTAKEIRDAKKELKDVEKRIDELKKYDEKLHHMADMQIEIDLDDGVKVNYKKFEGLVAKI